MFIKLLIRYSFGFINAWYRSHANKTVIYIEQHMKTFRIGYMTLTKTCCCQRLLCLCLATSEYSHKRYKVSNIAKHTSNRLKKFFHSFDVDIANTIMELSNIPKDPTPKWPIVSDHQVKSLESLFCSGVSAVKLQAIFLSFLFLYTTLESLLLNVFLFHYIKLFLRN